MAEIRCPMCGKPNPEELEVCQFCEARLKPVTDELGRAGPPIKPGESPSEMDTGELETALPQWLREVRQQARESAEEETEQPQAEEETPPKEEEPQDLLAGLMSQGEEDEEIPDWLSSIRGEESTSFTEDETADDDQEAIQNLLGEEPAKERTEEDLPGWISDLGDETSKETGQGELSSWLGKETGPSEEEESGQSGASDLGDDWLADLEAGETTPAESTDDEIPTDAILPDWLKETDEGAPAPTGEGLPEWIQKDEAPQKPAESESLDWLADLEAEGGQTAPREEPESAQPGDMPDWLASLDKEGAGTVTEEGIQPTSEEETPDWLASLGQEPATDEASTPAFIDEDQEPSIEEDLPDWLASLESGESPRTEPKPEPATEMPDWLSSLDEDTGTTEEAETPTPAFTEESVPPSPAGEMPDWLSSLGEESQSDTTGEEITAAELEETSEPITEGDMPDWLASMGEETTDAEEQRREAEPPATESEDAPAFVDDEGVPLSSGDVDAIFSMDMPDWLSDVETTHDKEQPEPAEETETDISPAALPDWVQAMRPVEAVISETGESAGEQYMEESGPLAGLRGVLPAVTGVGPSSKPKAYSLKLQASEEQQANASLFEQMLASEIHPKPITTQPVVLSQRFLRWIIAILLVGIVNAMVFSGTQINPIPFSVSTETSAVIQFIREGMPENAPVLLIFDYEAARAGEMEAVAAPLIDHMIMEKQPRLTMLASTPTGTGLADRFAGRYMLQSDLGYQFGQTIINLGYLPGGAAGALGFAEVPRETMPTDVNGQNAWEMPVLQNVTGLSDFSAIFLLTDEGETARVWIEQLNSGPYLGDSRLMVVSSAQSGPMILPYYQSGQVDGMVVGLDDSAPIEQGNTGRPGMARRYWDAYGMGLLAAVLMISIGSLWSLLTRVRSRRSQQGEA